MESMEKKNPRKEEEALQPISLSEDLVMEILVRLPFRSLVRFRCVSKSWRSLTSDARKKLPRRPHGFFHSTSCPLTASYQDIGFVNMLEEAGDPVNTALSFLPPSTHLEHVDVCNGLVLCRLQRFSPARPFTSSYAVSNPATRKYAMLPPFSGNTFGMCWLAFDPDVSLHYNVLSIVSLGSVPFGRPHAYEVAIFSSKDRAWVVAEDRIELYGRIRQSHCHVFFNGVFYLLASLCIVLGFNLQGEVCQRIRLPRFGIAIMVLFTFLMGMPCFGVYGGCLQIAGSILVDDNVEMVVWVLKDIETNEWVVKHKSSRQAMAEKLPSSVSGLPNFILRSFHFDDDAILLTAGSTLFRYDLSTTNMTEVCALRDETKNLFYPYTPYYSEDLVFNF